MVRRCGLDVHKESVVACARVIDDNGELQLSAQIFGTTMSDLLILSEWLASHRVTLVGMESTGVFWKPVYMLLETEFECWLLNAQHSRALCRPGRSASCARSPAIERRSLKSARAPPELRLFRPPSTREDFRWDYPCGSDWFRAFSNNDEEPLVFGLDLPAQTLGGHLRSR
jgi:transposase